MSKTKSSGSVSWMPLILVSMASFVSALDQTFMNVSMSQVVADLNTTTSTIQTIMSMYTLITASMMLVSAKLQDIFGKRRIFIIGAVFYGIGTTVAAISPNTIILFLGWALLEGIGGAMMTPGIISIISGTYSGSQRTTALSFSAAITAISAGIGPLFGGVVTEYVTWRFGFAIELVFVLFIIIFFKKIPYFPSIAEKKDLDITGSIVSIIGLVLLVIGILQLNSGDYALTAILAIAGILVLIAFGWFEIRRKKAGKVPLFDISLLKNRNLTAGTLIILICCIVMAGVIYSVSIYLQSARGFSAIWTGIWLLPMTFGMMIVAVVASKFAGWLGHKASMLIGFVIAIIGCALVFRQFTGDISFWQLAPGMFLMGVGIEFPLSLASDTAMQGIPSEAQSSSSGLFSTGQSLGMSMGTAVIGVVMNLGAVGGIKDAIEKYIIPSGMSKEEGVELVKQYYYQLGQNLDLSAERSEFTRNIDELIIQDSMGIVITACAGLLLIAGLLTLFVLKGKKKNKEEVQSESAAESAA